MKKEGHLPNVIQLRKCIEYCVILSKRSASKNLRIFVIAQQIIGAKILHSVQNDTEIRDSFCIKKQVCEDSQTCYVFWN